MSNTIGLLSIGCDYSNSDYKLNGCINDAIDIAQTITNLSINNTIQLSLMLDNGTGLFPSKLNILSKINQMIQLCNNNTYSSIILYFAGHGFQKKDTNSDESDNKDESILTADFKYIVDDDFSNLIKKLNKNKKAIFIFDCCHSGSILDLPRITIGNQRSNTSNSNINGSIICVSATSDNGKSVEKQGRGLFTQSFCYYIRNFGINSKINQILRQVKQYLQANNTKMTVTVSCSNNTAIRKSSIINVLTKKSIRQFVSGNRDYSNKNIKSKEKNKNNKNKNPNKNLNKKHLNKIKKKNTKCEILSPFYIPKNKMRITYRNKNLKNCSTSVSLPWKPLALRDVK